MTPTTTSRNKVDGTEIGATHPWEWVAERRFPDTGPSAVDPALVEIYRFIHRLNRAALGSRYWKWSWGVRRAWCFFDSPRRRAVHMVILLADVGGLDMESFKENSWTIRPFDGGRGLAGTMPAAVLARASFTIIGGPRGE